MKEKLEEKLEEIKLDVFQLVESILLNKDIKLRGRTRGYTLIRTKDETWHANHLVSKPGNEKVFINGFKKYKNEGVLVVYDGSQSQPIEFYELPVDDKDINELSSCDLKEIIA
jgi:hypothetical protein